MSIALSVIADAAGSGHMNGWGGGWMWLFGVTMMVLLVVVVVWLVRTSTGVSTPPPSDPTVRAREVLAERLANGDVSTEEYRQRLGELERRGA